MTLDPNEFIALHGLRKYNSGDSADYFRLQGFLKDRGLELSTKSNRYCIRKTGSKGKSRWVKWANVIEYVDNIRVSEGLEPIFRRPDK